ncbi:hypothetical protein Tco_0625745 [Tanacetum coccineum]|uniref:Uncharacterized protein n=1 Tax=Tanacetum coccineum TaxID=301880 RepID=A0ABQ4WHP8_9ASTR
MAQLEKQLDKEEIHECDSKKCLTQLKKKFEKFFYLKPKEDFRECDGKSFQSYSGYTIQEFKYRIVRYQKGLEKGIDARAPHEENILISLMDSIENAIAERGLYKRAHDNRVHETMMQTHEEMISKDASEIDNNVARASHDKDNMTEENKQKMGLGYTDHCPLGQAIACHPKLYDAEVLGLHYVKPDVHDIEEILNDAEESQVKMKEKQFQFNYENMNNLYDTFVPQTEFSLEQEYFLDPSTSNVYSESSKDMSDLPIPKMPNERKLRWISDSQNELREFYKTDVIPMSVSLSKSSKELQQELTEEVHEMLNTFESMEKKVDRTSKKNEILQNKIDQLLEANIGNDVRNLVMQSYVEIKNKEEIERFSKESKDGDNFCNDVVEVKEKLSKQIKQSLITLIELFKKNQFDSFSILNVDCNSSELEMESGEKTNLFENKTCVLQTKIDELEKVLAQHTKDFENANIELFEKESGEKKNIFESETCVLQIKIVELEKTLGKENSDLLMKIDNLENAFADEVKRTRMGKLTAFEKENCDFGSQVTHLEKIIAQKTKDFDDVKLELSNRTAKFKATQLENLKGKSVETKFDKPSILGKPPADKLLIKSQMSKSWFAPKVVVQKDLSKPVTTQYLPKNEKDNLLKRIASLESKLASQDIRSCQKEYHELRTSYNALKVKFDSLNRTKRKTNVSKSSKPKVSVSEKVHTGESSKPFSKKVSQFTTYSLQKGRKFSKKS